MESDAGNSRGFGKLRQTNGGERQLSPGIKNDVVIKDFEFPGLKTRWTGWQGQQKDLNFGNRERPAVALRFD